MGFGVEKKTASSVADTSLPVPVPAPAPAPVAAPDTSALNPMIMQSPQAPTASSSPLSIETSSLAPPPQVAQVEPKRDILYEKPKDLEKPKEQPKPKEEIKKKDDSDFSIVTTKLEVDEKEMNIKPASIP